MHPPGSCWLLRRCFPPNKPKGVDLELSPSLQREPKKDAHTPAACVLPCILQRKVITHEPRAPGFSARKQNRDGSPIGPVLRKDIAEVDRYLATHQLNRRLTQALEVAASWGRDVLLA